MKETLSQHIYNTKKLDNLVSEMLVEHKEHKVSVHTATRSGQFYKYRWFQSHKLQQNMLDKNKTLSVLH